MHALVVALTLMLPAHRPFTVAQEHLLENHTLQVQLFQIQSYNLDGTALAAFNTQYATRLGLLPYLQLDAEFGTQQQGIAAPLQWDYEALALRTSPWLWKEVATNPALALRIIRQNNAPMLIDVRVVLADAAERWRWVASVVWQRELSGMMLAQNYEINGGVTWQLHPAWWLGGEARVHASDQAGARFAFTHVVAGVGPSGRWSPTDWPLDVLLTLFITLNDDHSDVEPIDTWAMAPNILLSWHI